ncbi:hypothetical protein BJ878DRAFT_485549 [Calycina marina]|uniref:SMODS and SLOG-associating 2TM effector domain-containing protein n=1 Tax=Calycina marina TaxID=1763456 RepID=A0A9P7ZBL6_9HELO|nr:hypothetical protein BJ878DRAFT_485549 [Calycina marina]
MSRIVTTTNGSPKKPTTMVANSHSPSDKQDTQMPATPTFGNLLRARTTSDDLHLHAVRRLEDSERLRLCRALGAISQDEEAIGSFSIKNLPDGLFKRILHSRRKSERNYYVCTAIYSTCVVLQVVLGATLTGLGASTSSSNSTSYIGLALTILAAANTVNAGIVALLHNSGLPGRFRNDWYEFKKVEMHVMELVHSGVVRKEAGIAEAIERCWAMYRQANETVLGNKSNSYIGTPPGVTAKEGVS